MSHPPELLKSIFLVLQNRILGHWSNTMVKTDDDITTERSQKHALFVQPVSYTLWLVSVVSFPINEMDNSLINRWEQNDHKPIPNI